LAVFSRWIWINGGRRMDDDDGIECSVSIKGREDGGKIGGRWLCFYYIELRIGACCDTIQYIKTLN
jgi:hypothetical protein